MPGFVGTGLLQRQGLRALLLLRSVWLLLEPRALLHRASTKIHQTGNENNEAYQYAHMSYVPQ